MADNPRVPLLVNMADVPPEPVDWLWHPYLPRGKTVFMEGDPGAGKTWVALAIAAGADVSRVHVLVGWQQGEMQGAISLGDLGPLMSAIESIRPALVIIDPVQAYFGAGVDIHRANETRPILTALAALGARYACTPLCIRHLSKASQDRAIYRGLGSIDFAAAARSILLAGQDPRDIQRRILAHAKSNLAPLRSSLAYEIRDGLFLWAGESPLLAEDLLRSQATDEERSAVDEAQDFLREILAEAAIPAKDVIREARKAGIAERTLDRAKKGLVKASRRNTPGYPRGGGQWVWQLLDEERHMQETPYTQFLAPLNHNGNHDENQPITRHIQERHLAPLNEGINGQSSQEVTDNVQGCHRVPLGDDDQERHGCTHGTEGLVREGDRLICGVCLGMPPERISAIWMAG